MKRIPLVTANLGNFDSATQPHCDQQLSPGSSVAMLGFNDQNFPPRERSMSPRLQAKIPKMLGWEYFPDFDYYLWIDGSMLLTAADFVQSYVDALGDADIALCPHPERASIGAELNYITQLMNQGSPYLVERYRNEPMAEQVASYLRDADFTDDSLFAATTFIYSKRLTVEKPQFFRDWLYHCVRYSVQDQLSLPYLLKHHRVNVKVIEPSRFDGKSEWKGAARNRIG